MFEDEYRSMNEQIAPSDELVAKTLHAMREARGPVALGAIPARRPFPARRLAFLTTCVAVAAAALLSVPRIQPYTAPATAAGSAASAPAQTSTTATATAGGPAGTASQPGKAPGAAQSPQTTKSSRSAATSAGNATKSVKPGGMYSSASQTTGHAANGDSSATTAVPSASLSGTFTWHGVAFRCDGAEVIPAAEIASYLGSAQLKSSATSRADCEIRVYALINKSPLQKLAVRAGTSDMYYAAYAVSASAPSSGAADVSP